MSYDAERDTIFNRFLSVWPSGYPVQYPGEDFSPPSNPKSAWARFRVLPNDANVAGMGGSANRYRHDGEIIVEIKIPEGKGDAEAWELADDVCDGLRGWQSGGLTVWTPRAVEVGVRDGWYGVNVIAPYERDTDFATA